MFIDFLGDKGGVRMMYSKPDIQIYGTKNGLLTTTKPTFKLNNMYETEIDAFLRCIRTGEKLPSHIDAAVITARMMQAMYDSADAHREIVLED